MSGSHNTHAEAGPSSLDRVTTCPASLLAIREARASGDIPEDTETNVYGAVGTFGHDTAEIALLHFLGHKKCPEIDELGLHKWLSKKQFFWNKESNCECKDQLEENLYQDGYEELEKYIDFCLYTIRPGDDKRKAYVEINCELPYTTGRGTSDWLMHHKNDDITIADLKWRRKGVNSKFNKQGVAYAMSYIKELPYKLKPDNKISINIFNPLVEPCVEPWELTYEEMEKFYNEEIVKPVALAEGKTGTPPYFAPNEVACKWCPLALSGKCKHYGTSILMSMPKTENADLMTDQEMVDILKTKSMVNKAYENIENALKTRLLHGDSVDGAELGVGKSNRRYENPKVAASFLEKHLDYEDIYEPVKMKSFTKVLKKIEDKNVRKDFEKNYLIKPEGLPTLKIINKDEYTPVKSQIEKLLNRRKRS